MLLPSADGALFLVSGALMLVSSALGFNIGFDIDYRFVTVVPGASQARSGVLACITVGVGRCSAAYKTREKTSKRPPNTRPTFMAVRQCRSVLLSTVLL